MKKKLIIIPILFLMAVLCLSASALTAITSNYDVPYAYRAPEIDGAISSTEGYNYASRIGSEDGTYADARFLWDYNYLYIAIEVHDTTPSAAFGTNDKSKPGAPAHVDNYDSVMLSLNYSGKNGKIYYTTNASDGNSQFNSTVTGDYNVFNNGCQTGDDGMARLMSCVHSSTPGCIGDLFANSLGTLQYKCGVTKDASGNQTGYVYEYALPWSKGFQPYQVRSGQITFAIRLFDHDGADKGNVIYQRVWQTDMWVNAKGYGSVAPGAWDGLNLVFSGLEVPQADAVITVDGLRDVAYGSAYSVVTDSAFTAASADVAAVRVTSDGTIYVQANIGDSTMNPADSFTFDVRFSGADIRHYTVTRGGTVTGGCTAAVKETSSGYGVEIVVPKGSSASTTGARYKMAFRVNNEGNGEASFGYNGNTISWKDMYLDARTYTVTIDGVPVGYVPAGTHFRLPAPEDDDLFGWADQTGVLHRAGEIEYYLINSSNPASSLGTYQHNRRTLVYVSGDTALESVSLQFRMLNGAAVRLSEEGNGLRFMASVDASAYEKLTANASSVSRSVLIVPTSYIRAAGSYLPEDLEAAGYSYTLVPVDSWNEAYSTADTKVFSASIINILTENYAAPFSAMGIIDVTYSNGSTSRYITPYAEENNSRSIYDVALCAYEDWVTESQSRYDSAKMAILSGYLNRVVNVTVGENGITYCTPGNMDVQHYTFPYTIAYADGVLEIAPLAGKTLDLITSVCFRSVPLLDMSDPAEDSITVSLKDDFDAIHINQVGYALNAQKRAIVTGGGEFFELIDAVTGHSVYRSWIEAGTEIVDWQSGDLCRYADFSAYTAPGTYVLRVNSNAEKDSYPFVISEDPFSEIQRAMLKMLYYQRCGYELTTEYAGIYAHAACHMYPKAYAYREDVTTVEGDSTTIASVNAYIDPVDMQGGWHDAGDLSKLPFSGITGCQSLLLAYTLFPDSFDDGEGVPKLQAIPESGNGTPDVLDETRVELEWLMKLQETSGAVHLSAFPWTHPSLYAQPGVITAPEIAAVIQTYKNPLYPSITKIAVDSATYYVYETSVEITALTCAVMAQAYRAYLPYDPVFANECLTTAQNAWNSLATKTDWYNVRNEVSPFNGKTVLQLIQDDLSVPKSSGNILGNGYGKMGVEQDSRFYIFCAATELYTSTGNEQCFNIATRLFERSYTSGSFESGNNTGFAMATIAVDACNEGYYRFPDTVVEKARQMFESIADKALSAYEDSSYEVPLFVNTRENGAARANTRLLTNAMTLIVTKTFKPELDCYDTVTAAFDYLLGRNALNFSFVSGFGENSVQYFHHRQSWLYHMYLDEAPLPGYMVFGCNYTEGIHRTHNSGSGDTDDAGTDPTMHTGEADVYKYLPGGLPYFKSYADVFPLFRYNEIQVDANTYPVFVAAYLRDQYRNS